MSSKSRTIDYIMSLKEDFSTTDLVAKGHSSGKVHYVKTQLLQAKAIFNVGIRYTKSGECPIYSTTHRPFSSRPTGIPQTDNQQVMEYMLWLNKDFTVMDIMEDLNISRSVIYKAKHKLIESGLLFHVGIIEDDHLIKGIRCIKIFSKEEKEFRKKKIAKFNRPKEVKEKKKKKKREVEVFTPVDPLAGFVRPAAV